MAAADKIIGAIPAKSGGIPARFLEPIWLVAQTAACE